ncbi:MAG: hypothetical protein WC551_14220, partial [Patescibacteria group bacterium]
MKTRPKIILDHPVFRSRAFRSTAALAAAQKKEVYLVGGFLRDLFAGYKKPSLDLDFAVENGAIDFGRMLAR